jgi:NAD(P)-dependent dehydrogenase (short-subunit alcohol dehydrogenase family)
MKIKNDIPNVNLSGKNIVITGATAGIGKETARSLAKMGANIFFATRNKTKTLNTISEIRKDLKNDEVILEHKFLDLIDLDSVRTFPSLLGDIDKVDVLINNAGVGHDIGVTKQGIERIFGINYLSHFLLTEELMPMLIKSSGRIINVSSMGYTGAKREHFSMPYKGECSQLGKQQRYSRSKAAQILFTKVLQRRFYEKNVSCTCSSLSPGGVRTNIFSKTYTLPYMVLIWMLWPIMINPPEGAKTSVYLATTEKPERTAGKYYTFALFRKNLYEKMGNDLVNDVELQEWLWKKSEELIGEEFHIGQYKGNNKYLLCS